MAPVVTFFTATVNSASNASHFFGTVSSSSTSFAVRILRKNLSARVLERFEEAQMFASSVEIHFRSPTAEGRSGMTSVRTAERSRTNRSSSDSESETQPSLMLNLAGGDLGGPDSSDGPASDGVSPFIACVGQMAAREMGTACETDDAFEGGALREYPPPVKGVTRRVLRGGIGGGPFSICATAFGTKVSARYPR